MFKKNKKINKYTKPKIKIEKIKKSHFLSNRTIEENEFFNYYLAVKISPI